MDTYRIMYALEWRIVHALTRLLFWCLINTKIILQGAHKQFVTRVHTLFNFLHESINDVNYDNFHTSSACLTCSFYVLLMTLKSFADDITMTRQM